MASLRIAMNYLIFYIFLTYWTLQICESHDQCFVRVKTCLQKQLQQMCIRKDCNNNPCLNQGVCRPALNVTSGSIVYLCKCQPGFTGKLCERDIDECLGPNSCGLNASCTNTPGSYSCSCDTGFTGDGLKCTDIDECLGPNSCGLNANCTNTPGSYSCFCDTGFTGDGLTCTDIDECLGPNLCALNANCTNTPGNYSCSCDPGFSGDGLTCTDIDECLGPNSCALNANCTNTPGNYSCSCNTGFTGDGLTCANSMCAELGSATAVAVYNSTAEGMALGDLSGISFSNLTGSVAVADFPSNKIYVLDAELNAQYVIVQNSPVDTTYDDEGFLYVTGFSGSKVHVYDSNGTEVSSFGSFGTGPGLFNRPWGITHKAGVLPELYVCDRDNKRIQVFHTNSTFIAAFGTSDFDSDPLYIAVDTNIYVSDGPGTLYIFNSTYTLINKFIAYQSPLYSEVTGIALYNGCLIVADAGSDTINVIDDNYSLVAAIGSSGTSVGQLNYPVGIAVTPLGAIYVSEYRNKRVQLFKVP